MNVQIIIGTRPELIKMAPVAYALKENEIPFSIINTAQHTDLLDPYWKVFGLKPDISLEVMKSGQSLTSLSSRIILQLQEYFDSLTTKPSLVLAQGDTTTVMGAAMVSFYNRIAFGHVEAGLRSNDLENPFPEEFNRKVTGITADFHFAPTENSRQNLLRENIRDEKIFVVGNTVVDALNHIRTSPEFNDQPFNNAHLRNLEGKNTVLITCHRRENHGKNLHSIINAVETLVGKHPELTFVWLLHPNPNVKTVISQSSLQEYSNFVLTEPLDYWDLLKMLKKCSIILTDSGGIQEESPSFGKPLIVLRTVTERPEAVQQGMARLAGADPEKILEAFAWAETYKANNFINPYGDGEAAKRIAGVIRDFLQQKINAEQQILL